MVPSRCTMELKSMQILEKPKGSRMMTQNYMLLFTWALFIAQSTDFAELGEKRHLTTNVDRELLPIFPTPCLLSFFPIGIEHGAYKCHQIF